MLEPSARAAAVSHALGASRVPAKVLLALTLCASLGGCRPEAPVGPFGVRRVAIVLFSDTLRPGVMLQATAVALNSAGEVVDVPISWQSLTPTTLGVETNGAIQALAPGIGIVRASVGAIAADRQLQLVNPPAVTIVPTVDSLTLELPGAAAQLGATPFDSNGTAIVGAPLTWEVNAPRIATVSQLGLVTPVAVGSATVRVVADGVAREIALRVTPAVSATAPVIASISPLLIGPGTPFTIRGARLQPTGAGTSVFVDGHSAQILTATDSLITAILSQSTLPCEPSATVAVQVSATGGVAAAGARLELAPQRTPAVGEALILADVGDLRCLELPGEGRYLVSVLNTARALGAGALHLTFDARSGLATPVSLHAPSVQRARAPSAHTTILEASRRAVAERGGAMSLPELQVAPLGELTPLRVPNLDAPNICTTYRPIFARTVYAGTHVYIVEDTASVLGTTPLLTGAMDAELQALGAEVDQVIWPIISRFGNPLVMDSRLDANNRIVIVVTPQLNEMQGGAVLAAVVTCDFYARAQFAASNVGEMLYLKVPTMTGELDAATAIARWRHAVRGTLAHELKHVVSFAEHIVRNLPLEETWLEEATAQHAEELFTRAITGATATGNTAYPTIRCEILAAQGDGTCAGTPALMKPTVDGLWDFLNASALRSPLGATAQDDYSYYGSSWSLLRWAMDHASTPEATFTQQLTLSAQTGVANLEARAGRSWEQMLARWSLSLATDGRVGIAPLDATLQYPSWNLGSIFAGLCEDLGPCGAGLATGTRYTREHPAQPLAPAGDFTLSIAQLAPAGFQLVEVSPSAPGTRRFIRLAGAKGAPPPSTARLAILRIH